MATPIIHGSASDSTFASVHTTAMATLSKTTPGSSNYSSISSSHQRGLDVSGDASSNSSNGKKSRHSLPGFLEQAYRPHHSPTSLADIDTNSNNTNSSTTVKPNHKYTDQQEKLRSNKSPSLAPNLNHYQDLQKHMSGPDGLSRINGSQRVQEPEDSKKQVGVWNIQQAHVSEFDFGSGAGISLELSLGSASSKRISKRSMSASHIPSEALFKEGEEFKSSLSNLVTNPVPWGQQQPLSTTLGEPLDPIRNEQDMYSTIIAMQIDETRVEESLGMKNNSNCSEKEKEQSDEDRHVGEYLFGSELRNMSFGDLGVESTIKENMSVDTAVNQLKSNVDGDATLVRNGTLSSPEAATGISSTMPSYSLPSQDNNRCKPTAFSMPSTTINSHPGVSNNITTPKTDSEPKTSNSNVPCLAPEDQAADYAPIVNYRRQRSMSLQDADLLTADQLTALMPDEAPPRRRFSSEEPFPENPWCSNIRRRKGPPTDSSATLRELLKELKSKCALIMKYLDAASESMTVDSNHNSSEAEDAGQELKATKACNISTSAAVSTNGAATSPDGEAPVAIVASFPAVCPFDSSSSIETSSSIVKILSEPAAIPRTKMVHESAHPTTYPEAQRGSLTCVQGASFLKEYALPETSFGRTSSMKLSSTPTPTSISKTTSLIKIADEKAREAKPEMEASQGSSDIDDDRDSVVLGVNVVDRVSALFDEVDHTMSRMADVMSKHISADQFSKLASELNDMCFLAQEVFRAESARRQKKLDKSREEMIGGHLTQHQSMTKGSDKEYSGSPQADVFTDTVKLASTANPSSAMPEVNDDKSQEYTDRGIVYEELSNGHAQMVRKEQNQRQHQHKYKHQYRYQPLPPLSSEDTCLPPEAVTEKGRQQTLKSYINAVLLAAENSVAEHMRIYNRMLIVPIAGYRIEGCNDLKKIERVLRPDLPPPKSLPLPFVTKPSSSLQFSLLSRATVVQGTSNVTDTRSSLVAEFSETNGDSLTEEQGIPQFESQREKLIALKNPSTDSLHNSYHENRQIDRVKDLSEAEDVLETLQIRGGSSNVGVRQVGTLAMRNPTLGRRHPWSAPMVGTGASPDSAVQVPPSASPPAPGFSIIRDCSKDHMGHEAYYYRDWFLGREHCTFVGQVDGLGAVIISIIKDLVTPTEMRALNIGRPNTLLAPFISPVSGSSIGSTWGANASHGSPGRGHVTRPELIRSIHSLYPARGSGQYLGDNGPGGGNSGDNKLNSNGLNVRSGSNPHINSSLQADSSLSSGGLVPTHPQLNINTSISSNSSGTAFNSVAANTSSYNGPPRWQYRCILRQKDVDSLRITLPEPEPGPLNNLARRVGKPQWKTILQSIHPAITQQVASKLKKVQTNPEFEKELAKFDETMLRFHYKFGVLLVRPGQTKEEEWFSNQMGSSKRFQGFLQSGALGSKVLLKGFEGFSAGLDTRSDNGSYSYYDTWGDGFEVMYHISTLLPFKNGDRQQIQRKRHIGNDIVCIIFVDGEQPFIPSAIKSQFLHIFVVIHPVALPDGTIGYSVAIASDEQVPEFGPPLPDPPIFKTSQELRAYLLCKMINGENAAYKAPRLTKPHQRARSGMLEDLVAKANCLTKDKDSDKKQAKQQRTTTQTAAATLNHPIVPPITSSSSPSIEPNPAPIPPQPISTRVDAAVTDNFHGPLHHPCSCLYVPQSHAAHSGHRSGPYQKSISPCCRDVSPGAHAICLNDASQEHPHFVGNQGPGASIFKSRRGHPNTNVSKAPEASFPPGIILDESKGHSRSAQASRSDPPRIRSQLTRYQLQEHALEGLEHLEKVISSSAPPSSHLISSTALTPITVVEKETTYLSTSSHHPSQSTPAALAHVQTYCHCRTSSCNSIICSHCDSSTREMTCSEREKVPTPYPTKINILMRHHINDEVLNLPTYSRSETSSPTEARFVIKRSSVSDLRRVSHPWGHPALKGRAVTVETECEGIGNTCINPGETVEVLTANVQGKSKSELNLLLAPAQEGVQTPTTKRSAVTMSGITSTHCNSPNGTFNESHLPSEIPNHYSPPCPVSMPHTTINVATVNVTPSYSSMKGRAHNFLATLVKRRASSNDSSTPGLTTFVRPKPSNLSTSLAPIETWSSSHTYRTQADQYMQHHPYCTYHDQQRYRQPCQYFNCCQRHYHHQYQFHQHSRPLEFSPELCNQQGHQSAESTPVAKVGEPTKAKGVFRFGSKAPVHINTSLPTATEVANYSNSPAYNRQYLPSPLASATPSSPSPVDTSNKSIPSVPLQSSTGNSNSHSYLCSTVAAVLPTSTPSTSSQSSIFSQSLRTVSSRDMLTGRPPFSASDCKASIEILEMEESGQLLDVIESSATILSSPSLVMHSPPRLTIGDHSSSYSITDNDNELLETPVCSFSESPLTYTPTSTRLIDSKSSLGSPLALELTPASASFYVSEFIPPPSAGPRADYMNSKPASTTSSHDLIHRQQPHSETFSPSSEVISPSESMSVYAFTSAPTAPKVSSTAEHLINEDYPQRGMSMSRSMLTEFDPILASRTITTSTSSSASSNTNTTAVDNDTFSSDLKLTAAVMKNNMVANNQGKMKHVVRRAISEESFLRPDSLSLTRMALIQSKLNDEKTVGQGQRFEASPVHPTPLKVAPTLILIQESDGGSSHQSNLRRAHERNSNTDGDKQLSETTLVFKVRETFTDNTDGS
ncbi:Rap/ran-GAP protein [Lobosporangium transversale]|nr:Rap/ran-GAP protein [Lobosporangium transversale]